MTAAPLGGGAAEARDPAALRRPGVVRGALLILTGYCLFIGFTALVAPRTFYDDFPFLAHWVERLPPYNAHLVTDVGGLYVGFAVVLGLAAWRPRRDLVIAACAGFLTVSVPHLLFHLTHSRGFDFLDGAAQIAALASLTIPPVVALWAARPVTDKPPTPSPSAVPYGPQGTRKNR